MNEYQKQTDDFMTKTGTTMTTKLLGNFPYFPEDKEPRDVYEISLKRNEKTYTFRFGQSLADSGVKTKRNPYGKTMDDHELVPRQRIVPTAYDVLASVTKNDPGTFKDFCSEYGYDDDSRKAEKIYFAVQEEWSNINRLFKDVLPELEEIN